MEVTDTIAKSYTFACRQKIYESVYQLQELSGIAQNERMDTNKIALRLQNMLKQARISEAELARRAKMHQPTVNRIVKGESNDPRLSNLEALTDALGYSLADLLLDQNQLHSVAEDRAPYGSDQYMVPLLSIADLKTGDKPNKTAHCPFKHSPNTFALEVYDNSMFATYGNKVYPEGCIIFVDKEKSAAASPGDLVIARLTDIDENGKSNPYTFRQLTDNAGAASLTAFGANYPAIINRPFEIIGVVIGAILPQ